MYKMNNIIVQKIYKYIQINSKAAKMIYYLRELKQSWLFQTDLLHIYIAYARLVVKSTCELCQTPKSAFTIISRAITVLGYFRKEIT